MKALPKLTYANVVSTLALFLALGGGAAYAANTIHSGDIAKNAVRARNIAPGAVDTNEINKRAIVSGKLAVGAVRSNQIADGAVNSTQIYPGAVNSAEIADGAVNSAKLANGAVNSAKLANGAVNSAKLANGAVNSAKIEPGSVAPSDLQFPVSFVANPSGGSASVPSGEPSAYPLSGATWTQSPGQVNVVFGAATATLAYDGSGSGQCQVFFEINLNGQQVGGGEISTSSTTLEAVQRSLGAQPEIDPTTPTTNQMTARIASNGDCVSQTTIESSRFRVLDFG